MLGGDREAGSRSAGIWIARDLSMLAGENGYLAGRYEKQEV